MARARRFSFAPPGLTDRSQSTLPATRNGQASPGVIIEPGRTSRGLPRPVKRWRLFVMNGMGSAFVRESPLAQPAQPASASPRRRSS